MAEPPERGEGQAEVRFLRKALIVFCLVGVAWALLKIVDVLLLGFGAVLVAIVLHAIAGMIRKRLPLGQRTSLAAAVGLLAGALGLCLWLFGSEVERQLASLPVSLPVAWAQFEAKLKASALGARLLTEVQALDGRSGWLLTSAPRLAGNLLSGAASMVLMLCAGIFLAQRPEDYRRGVLRLVPVGQRARADELLTACGVALRQWSISQLGSMIFVGVCAGVALSIAGVRSPLALGLLAGLGQAVPLVGPFAVAVPGLLLALADSPAKLAWTVLIYIGVGQVESNLFTPLLLREMVKLPSAVTLLAVIAFGLLLGPLGVLFATPLAVVIYILVKKAYVEGLIEGGYRRDDPPSPP